MENMRNDDTCMRVAALKRAGCFDDDGRRRVHCEKCGRCCKLDEEVALEKVATTEKMQDAATELALHGAYLTLKYSSCRIPQHMKWRHSVYLGTTSSSVLRALRP